MDLDEFPQLLFASAPAVREQMRTAGDDEFPDPEMRIIWFIDAGRAIARVANQLSANDRLAVFDAIERGMTEGSDLLSTCVATGLIEALATAVSMDILDPSLLATLLRPESRAHYDAWDQFTLGRSSLEPS